MERYLSRNRLANGNLVELILTGCVYILAVILPRAGEAKIQLSNLFVPLEVTLSVWGFSYFLLAIFCLYTSLPAVRRNPDRGAAIERVGPFFIISCILNIGWIFAWKYENLPLSAGIMGILLVVLTAIYIRLKIGTGSASAFEKFLVQMPFRVYLGWTSMVGLANLAALLARLRMDGLGFGPQIWPLLAVTAAVATSLFMLVKRGDILFSLVIASCLAGVFLTRLFGGGITDHSLTTASGTGVVMLIGAILYLLASGTRHANVSPGLKV
jgi:translocator protein